MELRRLQHIKGGSFTVSLPKKWVERRLLRKGADIAMFEEEDGSLRLHPISAENSESSEGIVLDMEDFSNIKALEYCIGTYYIQGSSKITVESKETIPVGVKRSLKLLRTELPGVEIAEEKANAMSFRVIIDPRIFLLESLIQETSSFSLHLQEDAVRSVLECDDLLASEVIERAKEALRHYRMTIRQVALASFSRAIAEKVGVRNCRECVTFALIARDLNRLVYHSSSIAEQFRKMKSEAQLGRKITQFIKDLSGITYLMQRDAVQAFLTRDIALAVTVMERMNQVRSKEKLLLTSILKEISDADLAVALSHIARDLRRIAGYSVAVADDAMNRTLTPVH